MKRKLTTIFCADGVGFGRMMEADEDAAMAGLRRRRAIMAELFGRHDGRQVNTWGDAVIAEFASVVEAVRCAVDIQEAIASENALCRKAERIAFRVGINLGDVMLDGQDIYGDGVNVAARLQELADPGGIMVSGTVHDLTHKQLAVGFDFAGEQKVKSIDQPVRAYSVRVDRRNAPPEDQPPDPGDAPAADTVFARIGQRADAWLVWLRAQPKRIRVYAGFIFFFFAINLLFDGIAFPWFVFPSIPFALLIWRHAGRERREREGG